MEEDEKKVMTKMMIVKNKKSAIQLISISKFRQLLGLLKGNTWERGGRTERRKGGKRKVKGGNEEELLKLHLHVADFMYIRQHHYFTALLYYNC